MGFLVKLAGKELKDIKFYLDIAVENIIEEILEPRGYISIKGK